MKRLAITCCIFFCINLCLAQPIAPSFGFDIKKANQQFDHINLQLSVQNLNLTNLQSAVDTLTTLSENADECVEEVQKKINNIELLIKQGGRPEEDMAGADLIYLNNQHKELADEQAQCRLFSIRSKEAIEAYKNAIADLKQEEALTRGLPLWSLISATLNAPPENNLAKIFTIHLPEALPSLLVSAVVICIALSIALMILFRFRKSKFARFHLRFKKLQLHSILLLTTFFITGCLLIYLLIASPEQAPLTLPTLLAGLLFICVSALMLTTFLFRINTIRAGFYWYSLDVNFFQKVIIIAIVFYTVSLVGNLFASSFNSNSPLWQLCQSLFLFAALTTTAYCIFNFCKLHRQIVFVKKHKRFIQRTGSLLLLTCALISIFGYQILAKHLAISGLTTFVIIFVTLLITQSLNKIYLRLYQRIAVKNKIIKYFGYRADQSFTEFLILKTVAQIIVVTISIYLIGQSWGFATDYIESIYERFLYGFHFANVAIYPTRIISGVVVFCVLYLVFRAISNTITSHQQFEDEEETQVAVASILTYIGFGLAIISGFLVAGFDFTGLAIIAGALSVGIGLGLQSIVNNFVSGLILLIEKPIRPGDRINVDGIEGFVKKIRVRSTQIITPSREDIIIPNSDLITHRVTNYMFSDKYCRINCEVGVAYGSDTQLVRDVLLNIANQHEEIIKSGRNKPIVLLRSFGDSNMIFQLWCLIKDVNKKFIIRSELNFAIDEAFRKHNICMAFPQRDINIKISDLENIKKDETDLTK